MEYKDFDEVTPSTPAPDPKPTEDTKDSGEKKKFLGIENKKDALKGAGVGGAAVLAGMIGYKGVQSLLGRRSAREKQYQQLLAAYNNGQYNGQLNPMNKAPRYNQMSEEDASAGDCGAKFDKFKAGAKDAGDHFKAGIPQGWENLGAAVPTLAVTGAATLGTLGAIKAAKAAKARREREEAITKLLAAQAAGEMSEGDAAMNPAAKAILGTAGLTALSGITAGLVQPVADVARGYSAKAMDKITPGMRTYGGYRDGQRFNTAPLSMKDINEFMKPYVAYQTDAEKAADKKSRWISDNLKGATADDLRGYLNPIIGTTTNSRGGTDPIYAKSYVPDDYKILVSNYISKLDDLNTNHPYVDDKGNPIVVDGKQKVHTVDEFF